MFGREETLPIDLMLGSPPDEEGEETTQYVVELRNRLEEVFVHVWDSLQATAESQKRSYDVDVKGAAYEVGDLVWWMI